MGGRIRRTTKELDNLLLDAVAELIEKVGFSNITISSVVRKAKIEPISFYNRFNDIIELFDKYVRKHDYWMNDIFHFSPLKNSSKQNYMDFLVGLIEALNKDVAMQKILAWEITDDNYITRRTAKVRETHSEPLFEYFEKTHPDDTIDIRVISALLIGGIYYLCLHKNLSTLCGIDFGTEEGLDLLKKNVIGLVNRIYLNSESGYRKSDFQISKTKRSIKIAYEKGIDISTIKEIFDLSTEEIRSILTGTDDYEDREIIEQPVKRRRGRPKRQN